MQKPVFVIESLPAASDRGSVPQYRKTQRTKFLKDPLNWTIYLMRVLKRGKIILK